MKAFSIPSYFDSQTSCSPFVDVVISYQVLYILYQGSNSGWLPNNAVLTGTGRTA